MKLKSTDLLRYGLWLGVLNTANANRKYFGLPTTWVIHLTLNSLILFLPELAQATAYVLQLKGRARFKHDLLTTLYYVTEDVVVNNPNYALLVAPVPVAYMVSHPKFNIYKGDFAQLRFLGFGLDAIPHSTTAFGFTNLAMDALDSLRKHTPRDAKWRSLVVMADKHSAEIAGAFLASASVLYESGEYEIHAEELREAHGDESKINMEWSVQDTTFDLLSNTLGWLAGVVWRKRQKGVKPRIYANRRE